MKAKYIAKITLSVSGVLILFLFISACGTGGNSQDAQSNNDNGDSTDSEPEFEILKSGNQERKIIFTEPVEKNNCNEPGSSISKSASIQSTKSWSATISSDLGASVPGIEAKIGSALQMSYGQTVGQNTTVVLDFPANSHYLFTVEYYEIWEKGTIDVKIGPTLFPVPYEYRILYGLDYSRTILECPTPTPFQPPRADFSVNQTSGLVPLTVKFTDKSQGIITSWWWDFGDGNSSDTQSPTHTYDLPSYSFNTAQVCYDPNPFTITLEVNNSGGTSTSSQEGLINVFPKEFTVTTQIEPYALREGSGYKLLHMPGCSQVCGFDISSGTTRGTSCLTSVASESFDETGYYFDGQKIGLQASHQITYCPTSNAKIQTGVWEFDKWSEPSIIDTQISQPAGDHNPVITVDKDYFIRVHYKRVADCP